MAKQYLFFKRTAEQFPYASGDDLFHLELSSYFNNLNKIYNIFELYRFPDLKQIIEKDSRLQTNITHALPEQGIHGLLAICETAPPVDQLVKRLALCDEFILFQRSHEPNDTYLRYLSSKSIITKQIIYNWHIFVIRTMRSFFTPVSQFAAKAPGMDKIDKFFPSIPEHFAHRLRPHPDPLHLGQDIMEPLNTEASRLSATLLNILIPNNHSFLEIPTTSSHLVRQASLIGTQATGYPRAPLNMLDQQTRLHATRMNLPVVTEAVSRVVKLLDQLLQTPKYQQSHLFFTDIDREYKHHETQIMMHIPELKSFKRHLRLYRYIIATRFLLDNQYITHDKQINNFLRFNLIQTIYLTLKASQMAQFNQVFEKNALKLISEIYMGQKLKDLFMLKPVAVQLVESGFTLPPNESGKNHGFFLRLPENSLIEPVSEKKHFKLAMSLFGYEQKTGRHPELSEALKNIYSEILDNLTYLSDKLEFYRSFLSREAYVTLTNQCLSVSYSLDQVLKNMKSGDRLCIVSEKYYHYIDDTPHEFSFARLISEYLSVQNSFKFNLEHQFKINSGNPCLSHDVTIFHCR